LLTLLAFVLPSLLGRDDEPPGGQPGRSRATLPVVALLAVGVAASGTGIPQASAGFSDRTSTRPNTWRVATTTTQPYSAAVLADAPYVFYRVDEASGATAVDQSGNGLNGTYASVAYRQAGALPNNFGYSIGLNGNGRLLAGGNAMASPSDYSVELWFKTSSAAGGKLFGFESTRNATSPTYDRHLFMRPDGRLVYGGWSTKPTLLVSPAAYNNGGWHHLVLTASQSKGRQSTVMYVDGQQVASGSTTATTNFNGWWRVGYGSLPTGAGYPTSASFNGQVDNIAGYQFELSASRVGAHYAAR
jgi:hypothetical protein